MAITAFDMFHRTARKQPSTDAYDLDEGPGVIDIQTTWRCNFKCKMCGHSIPGFVLPPQPDFPIEAIEKISPILATAKEIWFSGYGEPLMHPQIFEIIKRVRSANNTGMTALTSNAALLSKKKNIDMLIQSGLDLIEVSFDGYDNDFGHEDGVRVITNLKDLRNRKEKLGVNRPRVQLTTILMKNNAGQLKEIIDICTETGISHLSILPLRAVPKNPNFDFWDQDAYANKDYVLPFLREATDYGRSRGIEVALQLMDEDLTVCRQSCDFPYRFFHVSVKGEVFMCPDGRSADESIYQKDASDIWNSEAYKRLRLMVDTRNYDLKCLECTVVQPDIRVKDTLKGHPFLT